MKTLIGLRASFEDNKSVIIPLQQIEDFFNVKE
jgi:hypothetical protein